MIPDLSPTGWAPGRLVLGHEDGHAVGAVGGVSAGDEGHGEAAMSQTDGAKEIAGDG